MAVAARSAIARLRGDGRGVLATGLTVENRRAESYLQLREMFERELIDPDPNNHELAAQLCAIKCEVDSRGRIKVERKEDMRRRGLPSPDRADAVAMALVQYDQVVGVEAHKRGRSVSDGILDMEW